MTGKRGRLMSHKQLPFIAEAFVDRMAKNFPLSQQHGISSVVQNSIQKEQNE